MTSKGLALPLVLACLTLTAGRSPAQKEDGKALALKARALLKQYCHRCHGVDFTVEGLNVLKRDSLLAKGIDGDPYLVPGKSAESVLYKLFGTSMPPEKVRERPTTQDREVIKRWIDSGAPDFATAQARAFLPARTTLVAMRDYLRKAPEKDRPYLRFFTLAHLHNNPGVADSDLRAYRAALSKVINSMSWQPRIVVPRAVDREQTVLALDLRDLDWQRDGLWGEVLAAYPYGLRYDEGEDAEVRKADGELVRAAGGLLSYVRGDWFVAAASRPPLYHSLLRLPDNADALEERLGVPRADNFRNNKLARAGFTVSGISAQNRIVERHEAKYGSYWRGYDFRRSDTRSNLIRFPLGPRFKGNDFDDQAFDHDSSEMMFNLPNGLQGYFQVNRAGQRIDEGPLEVVSDVLKTSGSPAIVSGLSCIYCHKRGVVALKDEIRVASAVGGRARDKVEALHPEEAELRKLMEKDQKAFIAALVKAVAPFLLVGEDEKKSVEDFPEPVGELARHHRLVDLRLETIAAEIGHDRPEGLRELVKSNKALRELGLGVLLTGGAIKRHDWEHTGGASLFQRVCRELELGTPWRYIR
jgi:serine/threonine-protein kinase